MPEPISPAISGSTRKRRFRVSPESRFVHANEARVEMPQYRGREAILVKRGLSGFERLKAVGKVTIDQQPLISIFELRYPGGPEDFFPVHVGGWVYGFNTEKKTLIVEGYRDHSDEHGDFWWSRRESKIDPDSCSKPWNSQIWHVSGVWIDVADGTSPNAYGFFLSPRRLSPDAVRFLISKISEGRDDPDYPLVHPFWKSAAVGYVAVPQPLAWCSAAAANYSRPEADAFQTLVEDPERQAKIAIATTLKKWSEGPLDQIENNLRTSPAVFLSERQQEHDDAVRKANDAAAYVAHCTDSNEFHAIERAAIEAGGELLSETIFAWGVVVTGMSLTGSGQEFINKITKDSARIPARYVLGSQRFVNEPDFAQDPLAAQGARLILTSMATAALRNIFVGSLGNRSFDARKSAATHAATHAKFLVARLAGGGAEPSTVSKMGKMRVRRGTDAIESIGVSFEVLGSVDAIHDEFGGSPKIDAVSQASIAAGFLAIGTIPEVPLKLPEIARVLNLALALQAFAAAPEPEDVFGFGPIDWVSKNGGWISGSADAGSFIADFATKWKPGSKLAAVAGVAGGTFGVVSGVIGLLGNMREAQGAVGSGNYAQAAAIGFSGGMSMASLVIGGIAMAQALGSAGAIAVFLGPLAIFVGVLSIIAGLIASLLKRDDFEQFAEFCFLGDQFDAEPDNQFGLIPSIRLPLPTAVEQYQLMMFMMSAFAMRWISYGPAKKAGPETPPANGLWWRSTRDGKKSTIFDGVSPRPTDWIQIELGYFPPGSVLEIAMIYRLSNPLIREPEDVVIVETRYQHTRAGVLQTVPDLEHLPMDFPSRSRRIAFVPFDAEFQAESEAIRVVRLAVKPARVFNPGNAEEVITPESIANRCLHYLPKQVFARILIVGLGFDFKAMPDNSRWLKMNIRAVNEGNQEVSTLDQSAYTDSDKFIHATAAREK